MMDNPEHALDVRMMRVLHLLLTQCSVSRTAVILGQGQPAVSLTLRRLREIFGDPLLVRSGSRLVPTERGLDIAERVRRVLDDIDQLVDANEVFDPAQSNRRVRIFGANCLGTFFLPRIAELLCREAPNLVVDLCATQIEHEIFSGLEEGMIDLVIGNWPMPRDNMRFAPLLDVDMVLVMRPTHPMADRIRLSMTEYLELDHLSPTPQGSAALSPVDGRLAQLDIKRRIALTVGEFALVPHMLARTDLVFTSSRPFAEQMASFMPFSIVGAPPELGLMKFYLLWHERMHRSPCNRWLRNIVRRVASEVNEISVLHARPKAAEAILPA